MEFVPTEIPEVVLIRPKVFGDARGYFMESWEERKFAAGGLELNFVQDNHSHSARHILRGLHYQIQHPQGKLVRVVTGAVYDVAVDIRRSSPTFGKWVGVELSAENHQMLWVPPGFAHGYLVLSEYADFLYKVTDIWSPPHERAIRWNDPEIGVKWPLPTGTEPVLSGKDAAAPSFRDAEVYP
ncbi:MAG TPA: dTDP-4-dehydrorhamnose 3,5-epimerase [Steroidobacteraceae bacterium]|nr:dTDP-4-dehydrorhamnose 3,5-epimerase [Steroidobacteraceae bacterium]